MNTARTPLFFIRGLCLLMCSLLSISCATRSKPDAGWNSLKLWHQVASNPPAYVPTGYGANQPRTDRDGTWFTDKRDGKCVFVPKQAVRGLAPGVLTGEAKKVTGHDDRLPLTLKQKIGWFFLFLVGGAAHVNVPYPD